MPCNCRTAKLSILWKLDPGKHSLEETNFICSYCHDGKKQWAKHIESAWAPEMSLECNNCHNHVKYIENNFAYLEEIYTDNFEVHIDNECDRLFVYNNENVLVVKLPLFKFNSIEEFENKIKTYITFS